VTTPRPRQLHAVTGLVPLTAWLLWELWRYQQALVSPEALAAATPDGALGGVLTVSVLGALAFHGGYGIVLASRRGDNAKADRATPDTIREHPLYPIYRRSSFLVLAFVLLHLVMVHAPRWRGEVAAIDSYDHLVQLLSATQRGIPVWAMVFSLGWAVTAFHVGFGWFAATERWRPRVLPGPRRMVALTCALAAAGIYVVGLHAILHFSNGTRWWSEAETPTRGRCSRDDELAPTSLPPTAQPPGSGSSAQPSTQPSATSRP